MHLLPYSLAVTFLLSDAFAAPHPSASVSSGLSIPLVRRSRPQRNATELGSWLQNQKAGLEAKYGGGSAQQKRASGMNLITNQNADSSFYGSIAVGTPAMSFNVILDTGSADLWLASSSASGSVPSGISTFDNSSSSTFKDLNTTFSISYGSGAASGTLGQDTVQMAGFQVDSQVFGVVDQITSNLLTSPVSGLLGLGFQSISASGAVPFWEALVDTSGTLDSPLMAFQLTRYIDDANAKALEPGGTFTLGAVNTTLYTGAIDYQDIPNNQEGYWLQELSGMTVNGAAVTLTSGTASYAAIDTGTTLIGGPASAIAALYGQISGSEALTGQSAGYWAYPCTTAVNVSLSFGGSSTSWSISNEDFLLEQVSQTMCVGAFFELSTSGTSAPAWIVGDTFLKNVYSVFRASPASVGFAQLSSVALAMNGAVGSAPSPTIGVVAATVSASAVGTGTDRSQNKNGAGALRVGGARGWSIVVGVVAGVLCGGALI